MCRHSLGVAGLDVITSCVAGPGGGRAAAQSPCKDDPGNTSHGYKDASDGETPTPLRRSAPKESRWATLAVQVEPADRLQNPEIPAETPETRLHRDWLAQFNPAGWHGPVWRLVAFQHAAQVAAVELGRKAVQQRQRIVAQHAAARDHRPGNAFGQGRRCRQHLQVGILARAQCHLGKQARTQAGRPEEHTSEIQSLMRLSYAVFCLKKKNTKI